MALSEDVIRVITSDRETAGFTAAFLRCKYGRIQLTQATYGSVVQHIECHHLKNLLIPDLHPVQRVEIGRKFVEAAEQRDEANRLLDEADARLHEELNLPYLSSRKAPKDKPPISKVKASRLAGRLEASFHDPEVFWILNRIKNCSTEFTTVGDPKWRTR